MGIVESDIFYDQGFYTGFGMYRSVGKIKEFFFLKIGRLVDLYWSVLEDFGVVE